MSTVHCHRCGRHAEPPVEVPQAEPLASEIRERVCAACWNEWDGTEVMVINELQLNFMDPRSIEILQHHMREFLRLDFDPPQIPTD